MNPFFDELRQEGIKLPNGHDLPDGLFTFSAEEKASTSDEVIKELIPDWYTKKYGNNWNKNKLRTISSHLIQSIDI